MLCLEIMISYCSTYQYCHKIWRISAVNVIYMYFNGDSKLQNNTRCSRKKVKYNSIDDG